MLLLEQIADERLVDVDFGGGPAHGMNLHAGWISSASTSKRDMVLRSAGKQGVMVEIAAVGRVVQ